MPHSGMVWAHSNCTVSWNRYLKARENKHAVSGLQKPFRLKTAFQRKGKKEVDCKYLIFTAVNHRVTVLFGQVFFFVFLFLVRSRKSYFCCDNMLPSSKPSVWPEKHAMYFFSFFSQYFMTHWTPSMNCIQCAQYVFSVSMSTCCDSFWARLLKDTTCMNYGWTVRG